MNFHSCIQKAHHWLWNGLELEIWVWIYVIKKNYYIHKKICYYTMRKKMNTKANSRIIIWSRLLFCTEIVMYIVDQISSLLCNISTYTYIQVDRILFAKKKVLSQHTPFCITAFSWSKYYLFGHNLNHTTHLSRYLF